MRLLIPLLLSVLAAAAVDLLGDRRGLTPPAFRPPMDADPIWRRHAAWRRGLALGVVASALYLGVFQPVALLGLDLGDVDYESLPPSQLFLLHAILAASLAIWYSLGFSGQAHRPGADWPSQLGWRTAGVGREIAIGAAIGVLAWGGVLVVLLLVVGLLHALGWGAFFPTEPPPMVLWIAGLPLVVRILVSLSAGVVEETFFRGFLQPRIGVSLSTILFVLAHLTYEQPLMLVGITLLSLIFAFLTRWRRSVWAAATAHAVFDAVQLVFLIPLTAEFLDSQAPL